VASKLKKFIRLIKANSIFYKGCAALDNVFPSKVLWSVCTCFQFFLDNCTHAEEREDVDDSLVDFSADHRDIILDRFGTTLPPYFKEVTNKDPDTEMDKRKNTKKQQNEETKEKKKEQQGGGMKKKLIRGLQDEGRRAVEHLFRGKFGRLSKIEWDIHVQMLAHPRPPLFGLQ